MIKIKKEMYDYIENPYKYMTYVEMVKNAKPSAELAVSSVSSVRQELDHWIHTYRSDFAKGLLTKEALDVYEDMYKARKLLIAHNKVRANMVTTVDGLASKTSQPITTLTLYSQSLLYKMYKNAWYGKWQQIYDSIKPCENPCEKSYEYKYIYIYTWNGDEQKFEQSALIDKTYVKCEDGIWR